MQKSILFALIAATFISSIAIYDITQKTIDKNNSIQSLGCMDCFEGQIESIADADTLIIDGRWVKLSLVDTPEQGQLGHEEAISFTRQICKVGENALVELDEWKFYDKSARVIAQVTCDGKTLNEELLTAGHAKIFTDNCDKSIFSKTDWAQSYGC